MVFILIAAFILPRLLFLLLFPPFTDESLYTRWGMLALKLPEYRFSTLSALNRQPMAMWIFGLGSHLTNDPIIGARLITLPIHVVAFIVLYIWLRRMRGREVAIAGSLFFALCPMAVFFQSLALIDGMLISLVIISLFFFWEWRQTRSFVYPLLGGIISGLIFFLKSSLVHYIIALAPLYALLIKDMSAKKRIGSVFVYLLPIAILVGILFRLPNSQQLAVDFTYFTIASKAPASSPFTLWIANIVHVFGTSILFTSIIFLPTIIIGTLKKRDTHTKILFIFGFVLLSLPILIGKLFSARYYVPALIVFVPLVGSGIVQLLKGNIVTRVCLGILIVVSFLHLLLLFASAPVFFSLFPENTPLATERTYAISYTSGYGIREAIAYTQSLAPADQLLIAVPDSSGNPSDYIISRFFWGQETLTLFVSSPEEVIKIKDVIAQTPVYFISRTSWLSENSKLLPYLIEIKRFNKPYGEDSIGVYMLHIPV